MPVIEINKFLGLNSTIKPLAAPKEYFRVVQNMIPLQNGYGMRPMWGYTKATSGSAAAFSSAPVGCTLARLADGTTQKLWIAARKLYIQNTSSVSALTSTLFHSSNIANFVSWQHKIIILQDTILPRIYTPTAYSTSLMGGWSAAMGYPVVGAEYQSRLWLTGSITTNSRRIWVSDVNNAGVWRNSGTPTGDLSAFYIDTTFNPKAITAGADFLQIRGKGKAKKLIGQYPFNSTRTSGGEDYFRFAEAEYIRGTTSHKSIINTPNDQIYLSSRAVISMKATETDLGFETRDLSENIEPSIEDMASDDKQGKAFAVADLKRGYIFLWYCTGTNTVPTKVIVLDTTTGGWGIATVTAECGLIDDSNVMYIGDSSGNIHKVSPDLTSYNGTAIEYIAQTAYLDFASEQQSQAAYINKRFKSLEVDWETTDEDYSLTVDVIVDEQSARTFTLNTNIVAGDSLWGQALWGFDLWADTVQSSNRIYPNKTGRRIALRLRSSTLDNIVAITGLRVEAEYMRK